MPMCILGLQVLSLNIVNRKRCETSIFVSAPLQNLHIAAKELLNHQNELIHFGDVFCTFRKLI